MYRVVALAWHLESERAFFNNGHQRACLGVTNHGGDPSMLFENTKHGDLLGALLCPSYLRVYTQNSLSINSTVPNEKK